MIRGRGVNRYFSGRVAGAFYSVVLAAALAVAVTACGFPAWRDQALRDVAEGRWHVNPEQIPPGGASSQTIEFYDSSGRHLGYGKVQGGAVDFFNLDSSRAGFGKGGR